MTVHLSGAPNISAKEGREVFRDLVQMKLPVGKKSSKGSRKYHVS
jgi:hypothetical protein